VDLLPECLLKLAYNALRGMKARICMLAEPRARWEAALPSECQMAPCKQESCTCSSRTWLVRCTPVCNACMHACMRSVASPAWRNGASKYGLYNCEGASSSKPSGMLHSHWARAFAQPVSTAAATKDKPSYRIAPLRLKLAMWCI
jgi:hypothetical protein